MRGERARVMDSISLSTPARLLSPALACLQGGGGDGGVEEGRAASGEGALGGGTEAGGDPTRKSSTHQKGHDLLIDHLDRLYHLHQIYHQM